MVDIKTQRKNASENEAIVEYTVNNIYLDSIQHGCLRQIYTGDI